MKTKILKICFVVSFMLFPLFCFAQLSVKEAIAKMPTQSIPFNATRNTKFLNPNYGVTNPNNVIPDKLYDNVQLTEYTHASDDPELGASSFRKFAIPGSNNVLLVVSFGGATDWRTDVMVVVNPSGQILGTLEVAVRVMDMYVKQFRVTAQGQVIVTTIKPTSATSIPFGKCSNFAGYRQDITYSVNAQGQFVQGLGQTYKSMVYKKSHLWDETINLWEGGEILQ